MWIGAIICGVSLGCTLLLVPIDKRMEKKLEQVNGESATVKSDEKISLTDVRFFKAPFWLLTLSCIVVYGTVLPFNNVASAFLQHRNFMAKDLPWFGNRTYVSSPPPPSLIQVLPPIPFQSPPSVSQLSLVSHSLSQCMTIARTRNLRYCIAMMANTNRMTLTGEMRR